MLSSFFLFFLPQLNNMATVIEVEMSKKTQVDNCVALSKGSNSLAITRKAYLHNIH